MAKKIVKRKYVRKIPRNTIKYVKPYPYLEDEQSKARMTVPKETTLEDIVDRTSAIYSHLIAVYQLSNSIKGTLCGVEPLTDASCNALGEPSNGRIMTLSELTTNIINQINMIEHNLHVINTRL